MTEHWEEDGNPWRVKSVTTAFENPWFRVEAHHVVHPGGADGVYGVIRMRRVAVGVLPIDDDGMVWLVGQWRFPLGRYSWEMPEGGSDPNEAAVECATRELAEETGLRAGRLEPILELDLSNSVSDERAVMFLATDLQEGDAAPEPTEVLQRRKAPFRDVLDRAVKGQIRDSMTVAALLRAYHMAITGQLPAALARAMLSSGD